MVRLGALAFSCVVNVALIVTLTFQLSQSNGLQYAMTVSRPTSPMMSTRAPMTRCFAKKGAAPAEGMVPDKNTRPDVDIVPRDGSILDYVFNEWITKKSPTRSLILDRQRQMNEERARLLLP